MSRRRRRALAPDPVVARRPQTPDPVVPLLARAALAILIGTVGLGCATPEVILDVGQHRVRLAVPKGWEHLDHGRSQVLRKGDARIWLEDLGASSRRGVVRDLEAARAIWMEGRRADAFERVRDLSGPSFSFTTSHAKAMFWRPWWDMQAAFGGPDSASIGAAFDSLIAGTVLLAPDSPDAMIRYAVEKALDGRGYEFARKDSLEIHGARWHEAETWSPVAHLDRRAYAVFDDGGYLLALWVDRDPDGSALKTFPKMLRSIEVLH